MRKMKKQNELMYPVNVMFPDEEADNEGEEH